MSNTVLTIHVMTVLISISGFIFRGILLFSSSSLLHKKWIKILPHVNDTVLILSAIILVRQAELSFLSTPWLQAKIVGLVLYILLGLIAFRLAKNKATRLFSWIEAIFVFMYVIGVAVTKNPLIIF